MVAKRDAPLAAAACLIALRSTDAEATGRSPEARPSPAAVHVTVAAVAAASTVTASSTAPSASRAIAMRSEAPAGPAMIGADGAPAAAARVVRSTGTALDGGDHVRPPSSVCTAVHS
eukprot:tig00000194_g14800.t1